MRDLKNILLKSVFQIIFYFKEFNTKVEDNSVQVLHADGAHDANSVYLDLKAWWPKMIKGGTIVGDDYSWPSVKEGLLRFVKENSLDYKTEKQKFIIVK